MPKELDSNDFDVSFGYSVEDDDRYLLSATAKNGTLSFQLGLSADLIASVVLAKSNLDVAMSPDGIIRIYADCIPTDTAIGAADNLDDLIKQSIIPQMLEDEPDAAAMLQILRKRLITSLAAIDEAISNLEPK